ncbi:MAG: non-canonical purine NTP pyrophosphatase [Pseudomonadota bacterium]
MRCTFGEMGPTEKHAISHRARAFRHLVEISLAPLDYWSDRY